MKRMFVLAVLLLMSFALKGTASAPTWIDCQLRIFHCRPDTPQGTPCDDSGPLEARFGEGPGPGGIVTNVNSKSSTSHGSWMVNIVRKQQ